jgi:hypothetical protein
VGKDLVEVMTATPPATAPNFSAFLLLIPDSFFFFPFFPFACLMGTASPFILKGGGLRVDKKLLERPEEETRTPANALAEAPADAMAETDPSREAV